MLKLERELRIAVENENLEKIKRLLKRQDEQDLSINRIILLSVQGVQPETTLKIIDLVLDQNIVTGDSQPPHDYAISVAQIMQCSSFFKNCMEVIDGLEARGFTVSIEKLKVLDKLKLELNGQPKGSPRSSYSTFWSDLKEGVSDAVVACYQIKNPLYK